MDSPQPPRTSFRALLARHGRILTFRATAADYQALGWWDLAWGIALAGLIEALMSWSLGEEVQFYLQSRAVILNGCTLGLLCLFLLALLRPLQGPIWHIVPLVKLTFALEILFTLPTERWIAPEYVDPTNLFAVVAVMVWRSAIVARFLWQGMELRPLPALVVAALPELLGQVLRDSRSDLALFAFIPLLLVYLLYVGKAWWSAERKRANAAVVQEATP
jgi:hypothetical protein